jgi:molybdopterin-guanine dinucleotide biosynthesis protein A
VTGLQYGPLPSLLHGFRVLATNKSVLCSCDSPTRSGTHLG